MINRLMMVAACAAALGAGCSKQDNASSAGAAGRPAGPAAVPVNVAEAQRRDVPVEVLAIGSVQPLQRVVIKSQIPGELSEVHFHEGDQLKQGDLLFTIDPRPYEVALQAAQAALAADSAMEKDARELADRLANAGPAAIERDVEAAANKVAQMKATLLSDQAAIDNARLRLGYTQIRSPIDGRTGTLLVDRGNIVKENETELLTIMQMEPVYVSFAVPQGVLADLRKSAEKGDVSVSVVLPGDPGPAETGIMSFIDNAVDSGTGSIQVKAQFPNADRRLWPGTFVNVTLRLATRHDAVVVPSVAVQAGQKGQHVFVIGADDKAQIRKVVAGTRRGELTVIESGLEGGERVVTDGQMRLNSGVLVAVKPSPAAAVPTTMAAAAEAKP